jgi:hypothetical protein
MISDHAELVDRTQTADDDPLPESHVAAQSDAVCHDHVASDDAIMADVGVGHEQTIAPDRGLPGFGCPAIEGDKLANHGLLTDLQKGWLALILEVLRRTADRRSLVNLAFTTKASPIVNNGMRPNPRSFPNGYIILNDGVRSYVNILSKVGFWTDNGVRIDMNRHQDEKEFLLVEDS